MKKQKDAHMYITNGCTYVHNKNKCVHNKKCTCTQKYAHMYTKKDACMYKTNGCTFCTQKGCLYIYIYTNICVCLFDYY